jgi:shikimate dehydrogenase
VTRLAVLGSPIAHSKSPTLHAAAYAVLGLDWRYDAIEMTGDRLPAFLAGLDAANASDTSNGSDVWRGLSLTMPLKRDVLALLDESDPVVQRAGGANTVLLEDGRKRGYNTDVAGLVRAFVHSGIDHLDSGGILGGGATAASALVALGELGTRSVQIFARTPERAADLAVLGADIGVDVAVRPLADVETLAAHDAPDAIISTLPGGASTGIAVAEGVRAASVLFEVAYDPWPSALVEQWLAADGRVIDGLDMLVEQALVQVRIFVGGNPNVALENEAAVLGAMRASVAR